MKKLILKTTAIIGICAAFALGIVSCDKEEATAIQPSVENADYAGALTKSAPTTDTTHMSGNINGVHYDITIVVNSDDCTFTIDGDITTDEGTFHIHGTGAIKSKTFSGTITDSNGNNVVITDEWVNIIYSIFERQQLAVNIIQNTLDTLNVH